MKNKTKLLFVFAIVASLAIGFLTGISVDYPKVDNNNISGTIGQVKNYRNSKATEEDIQLKNELLADTARQKKLEHYLSFYYARAISMGANIDFAVNEANKNEAFLSKNGQLVKSLESYNELLKTARKELLMAVAACNAGEKADATLLRKLIKQSNNVIAQMNYRNNTVISFIGSIDAFVSENGTQDTGLTKAHDLLVLNEVGSSLLTKDKVLLSFLGNKKLYGKDYKPANAVNYNEAVKQDMEQLNVTPRDMEQLNVTPRDMEQLRGLFDMEQLGIFNSEVLGLLDGEKLGYYIASEEKLGTYLDSEKLGVWDAEKLGVIWVDAESLGAYVYIP